MTCAAHLTRKRHVLDGGEQDHSACVHEDKEGVFYLCDYCAGTKVRNGRIVALLRDRDPDLIASAVDLIHEEQRGAYANWKTKLKMATESDDEDGDDDDDEDDGEKKATDDKQETAGGAADDAHREKPEPEEARDAKRARPEISGDADANTQA